MNIKKIIVIASLFLFLGCAQKQIFKAYVAPVSNTQVVEKIVFVGKDENHTRSSYTKKREIFKYAKGIKNNNAYALIIGINEYKENTNVEFADFSALEFEKLAKI